MNEKNLKKLFLVFFIVYILLYIFLSNVDLTKNDKNKLYYDSLFSNSINDTIKYIHADATGTHFHVGNKTYIMKFARPIGNYKSLGYLGKIGDSIKKNTFSDTIQFIQNGKSKFYIFKPYRSHNDDNID